MGISSQFLESYRVQLTLNTYFFKEHLFSYSFDFLFNLFLEFLFSFFLCRTYAFNFIELEMGEQKKTAVLQCHWKVVLITCLEDEKLTNYWLSMSFGKKLFRLRENYTLFAFNLCWCWCGRGRGWQWSYRKRDRMKVGKMTNFSECKQLFSESTFW